MDEANVTISTQSIKEPTIIIFDNEDEAKKWSIIFFKHLIILAVSPMAPAKRKPCKMIVKVSLPYILTKTN